MDNWWIEGIDDPYTIAIAALSVTIIPLASVSTVLALVASICERDSGIWWWCTNLLKNWFGVNIRCWDHVDDANRGRQLTRTKEGSYTVVGEGTGVCWRRWSGSNWRGWEAIGIIHLFLVCLAQTPPRGSTLHQLWANLHKPQGVSFVQICSTLQRNQYWRRSLCQGVGFGRHFIGGWDIKKVMCWAVALS